MAIKEGHIKTIRHKIPLIIQMVKIKSFKMVTKPDTNEKWDLSYIAHGDLK